jgi:hypothetical protein
MPEKIKMRDGDAVLVMVKDGKVLHYTPNMSLPAASICSSASGSLLLRSSSAYFEFMKKDAFLAVGRGVVGMEPSIIGHAEKSLSSRTLEEIVRLVD